MNIEQFLLLGAFGFSAAAIISVAIHWAGYGLRMKQMSSIFSLVGLGLSQYLIGSTEVSRDTLAHLLFLTFVGFAGNSSLGKSVSHTKVRQKILLHFLH